MIRVMTQRVKIALALMTATAALSSSAVAAVPAKPAPKAVQEVITIQRTAKTGLAALALIGKVKAEGVPGFLATVDRTKNGAWLGEMVDFNAASGLSRYGHGGEAPLCDAPFVCSIDTTTGSLTFTMTETDDADAPGSDWKGVTRYLALRGTKIDLQVAAIGFTVKRHTASTFARVTREQADADGVDAYGLSGEIFRAAQLRGGARGSISVLQLPCDSTGAGAATFSATGDTLPAVVNCSPADSNQGVGVYVADVGASRYPERPGLFSRTAAGATDWQVSGAVSGVSSTLTRLFVLSY